MREEVHLFIIWELLRFEQLVVKFHKLLKNVFANLCVSFFFNSFANHHVADVVVPFFCLRSLFGRELELADVIFGYSLGIELEGTDEVFNLPHIEQIFSTVCIFESISNNHCVRRVWVTKWFVALFNKAIG